MVPNISVLNNICGILVIYSQMETGASRTSGLCILISHALSHHLPSLTPPGSSCAHRGSPASILCTDFPASALCSLAWSDLPQDSECLAHLVILAEGCGRSAGSLCTHTPGQLGDHRPPASAGFSALLGLPWSVFAWSRSVSSLQLLQFHIFLQTPNPPLPPHLLSCTELCPCQIRMLKS